MSLLTSNDVLNKKFQSVKFREGYDQIEVDEFLDDVVATIYALEMENQQLRNQELEYANLPSSDKSAGYSPPPVGSDGSKSTNSSVESILELAQRLHDQYVEEAKQSAEQIIIEAKKEASSLVAEAEISRRRILSEVEEKKARLESKIDELRQFESEYRRNLTDHLNHLLEEINAE